MSILALRSRVRWAILLSGLVCAVVGSARPVAAQFTVNQLEEHLRLGKDSLTQVIAVRSESSSPQQLRIQVQDWIRDSTGQNLYGSLGTLPGSCGQRLTVFPLALQLPPGGTEYLRVSYDALSDDPGCWSIVLLEAVKPPSTTRTEGAAVSLTILTGVKFYIHAAGEVAEGDIEFADVETSYERTATRPTAPDSVLVRDVVVRYVNSGTAHLRVKSTVEIRDASTRLVHQLTGPEAYLTPGAFRDILVRVPSLPTGRYVAITLLDDGGPEIKAAQVEFEVP